MELFIQNLEMYNRAIICGSWFKLGDTEENSKSFIVENVKSESENPSIFISDFKQEDILYKPSQFKNVFKLNELVGDFYELEQEEQDLVNAIMEAGFEYDLEKAMKCRDCYYLNTEIQTETELGYYLIEELETCQIPDFIKCYIDYEAFGRDEQINSNGVFTMYGYLEMA